MNSVGVNLHGYYNKHGFLQNFACLIQVNFELGCLKCDTFYIIQVSMWAPTTLNYRMYTHFPKLLHVRWNAKCYTGDSLEGKCAFSQFREVSVKVCIVLGGKELQ